MSAIQKGGSQRGKAREERREQQSEKKMSENMQVIQWKELFHCFCFFISKVVN